MSATGERVSEARLRELIDAADASDIAATPDKYGRSEYGDVMVALRELLALRQLLRESKPALEAGATALHDAGQFNIKCGQTAHGKFQCDDAVKIRALAHRAGELT